MKPKHLTVTVVAVLTALVPVRAARADPAPPPGASIEAGSEQTQVQMVSEDVLLTVDDYHGPSLGNKFGQAAELMIGHVKATFEMHNQGADEEAMNVRFPLDLPGDSCTGGTVESFAAWVGNAPASITIKQEAFEGCPDTVPWAAWPVTFPPDQTVTLRVEYDVHPHSYASGPNGTFFYILGTGKGWFGSIGKGTITYRLPYPISDLNIEQPDTWIGEVTLAGTDAIWQFTDLEPQPADAVWLTVMIPAAWKEIETAQSAANADPGSAEARLRLADALTASLAMSDIPAEHDQSLTPGDGNKQRAEAARLAYQQATKLAPDNVDAWVKYLDLALEADPPEKVQPILDQALAHAPGDQRLMKIQREIDRRLTDPSRPPEPDIPATWIAVGAIAIAAVVIGGVWIGMRAYRRKAGPARE
jgi:hypothetical protein